MATITINLAGFVHSYTIGAAEVGRVIDVYRGDGQTNADVAEMIADGWIASLVGQVAGVEENEAVEAARASIVPITISKVTS